VEKRKKEKKYLLSGTIAANSVAAWNRGRTRYWFT